jgi:catechol 2,3-dioxygenase-like lactoylglutathione lyase family enzyme
MNSQPSSPRPRPSVRAVTPLFVVADLQRSLDFYCQKLGFVEPAVHGDPPCFAMINRDGFDLMLSLAESASHVRPNGPNRTWDVYISIADVAAEIAALEAAGVRIDQGPRDTFYDMREIEVLDPDGHRICLAQDTGGEPLRVAETWEGVLDIGSVKLRLLLKLAESQGAIVGRLDSPDQGATNLPIDSITRAGSTLRFEMRSIGAKYEGSFDSSVRELTGAWTQGGRNWPLTFRKS